MLSNLKKLRQEYGISQQRLANALSMSQQSINQYENHDIEPDIGTLTAFADYFDTSIDYIVGRVDIRRRIENTQPFHLNSSEAEIITEYRALNEEERKCVTDMVRLLLKR